MVGAQAADAPWTHPRPNLTDFQVPQQVVDKGGEKNSSPS